MQTLMGEYRGDKEQFSATLQQQIQNQVDAIADPSNIERIIVQPATTGNSAQDMTVTVIDKKGRFQDMRVNMHDVRAAAQDSYNKALAGEMKIGEAQVGVRPATFYDVNGGRAVSMNVDGRNSSGVDPNVFSGMLSKFMEFEGYKAERTKGSVGFGQHVNSGLPVPSTATVDDSLKMLRNTLENNYIPAVRKQLKGQGLSETPEALMVLTDLMYHGWTDSAGPVVEAMAQVRKAAKSPVGAYQYPVSEAQGRVWQALHRTPAYQQAQAKRKQYIEQTLRDWMFEVTH